MLQRLAETMERNKELRETVRSALIYPTILICVAVVSVMVLLIFVVPQFQHDVRAGGQGAAAAHAGRHRRRHVHAQLVVGGRCRRGRSCVLWFRRRGANPAVRRARDARLLRDAARWAT